MLLHSGEVIKPNILDYIFVRQNYCNSWLLSCTEAA